MSEDEKAAFEAAYKEAFGDKYKKPSRAQKSQISYHKNAALWGYKTAIAYFSKDSFACSIIKSRTNADTPADCNWPLCGCDPKASKVCEALEEMGLIPDHE
jgi:hypothetical protein